MINRRLSVILFLVFLLPSSILFAEKWVLAATPLECMQNDSQIVAASEQIPKLILADLVNSEQNLWHIFTIGIAKGRKNVYNEKTDIFRQK